MTCWWWRSNSVELSSQNALAKCNEWQEDSCEVVDVDGVPKRAGLDAFFAQPTTTPVDIDVFDGPSQKHQQLSGMIRVEQPESGSAFPFRLLAQDKTICKGDFNHEFLSMSFSGTARCFNQYEFSLAVTATGYRYANGRKIGYAFDIILKKDESYIRATSKP
jgi:hypothetical protein